MPDKYVCAHPLCGKQVTATRNQRYHSHKKPDGSPCENSSAEIPPREVEAGPVKPDADPGVPEENRDFCVCPHCGRKVKLTALGYLEHHDKTLRGADRCPNSGVRFKNLRPTKDVVKDLPETVPEPEKIDQILAAPAEPAPVTAVTSAPLMLTAGPSSEKTTPPLTDLRMPEPGEWHEEGESGQPIGTLSPESTSTQPDSVEWTEVSDSLFLETVHNMLMDALGVEEIPAPAISGTPDLPQGQPSGSGFDDLLFASRPASPASSGKPRMSEREQEIAARVKEIFYAYQNRKTNDNRSAQTTLGPSEIGTPCDRRLAMSLMGVEPVNPGGDGWAAFVGTWGHEGMRAVFEWADAGTGRFATEVALTFPSDDVPRGTTDLIDRTLFLLTDWKFMGEYSLKSFKNNGIPEGYRIQGQVYGLGAVLQGEKIREIAIIGLPRAGRSLDEMWVRVMKFDRKEALAALARVKRIRKQTEKLADQTGALAPDTNADLVRRAGEFGTATEYECRFCPFHLKGDKQMQKGCPGA